MEESNQPLYYSCGLSDVENIMTEHDHCIMTSTLEDKFEIVILIIDDENIKIYESNSFSEDFELPQT